MSDRRRSIMQILTRTGTAGLAELCAELQVSPATIRRDVEALRREGRLVRTYGRVHLIDPRLGPAARRADQIGILVADNRYLRLVAEAARRECQRRNVGVDVRTVASAGEEEQAVAELITAGCRGLIYAPQWQTPEDVAADVPWLADRRLPLVLAGREAPLGHPLFTADSVIADHRYAMRLAVQHLHDLGHRRILASIRTGTPPSRLLAIQFGEELRRLGLEDFGPPSRTPDVDEDYQPLLDRLLECRATSMIIHTDEHAQVLIRALRASGRGVPATIAVVAYDDIVGPVDGLALTTVSPPKHQLGIEAVSLLMRRLRRRDAGLEDPPTAHVRLLPELTQRSSTAHLKL